ncbi:MAG TPA: hypothetical protein VN426_03925 [Syntrophomonadaceae bacterium]|nr:hypothetical protein [Syntrophomonadaceae bacterium]
MRGAVRGRAKLIRIQGGSCAAGCCAAGGAAGGSFPPVARPKDVQALGQVGDEHRSELEAEKINGDIEVKQAAYHVTQTFELFGNIKR